MRSLQVARQHCFTLLSLLRPSHTAATQRPLTLNVSVERIPVLRITFGLWFIVFKSINQQKDKKPIHRDNVPFLILKV